MKVYAVIEQCPDDYYSAYTILDNRVYLKEEDAKKILEKMKKEGRWWPGQFTIYDFEVSE